MQGLTDEIAEVREPNYNITPLLVNRWSPRAMTGESIDDDELMALFEAARWAPSSYNSQPWRFIYAKRDTEHWDTLFELLDDGNKTWCKNAAVLVVVVSRQNMEYKEKPDPTHQLTTGCAFENICLEATARGFVSHGMAGFDADKARKDLDVPAVFQVIAMLAIGKRAEKDTLPKDLRENEKPSNRRPLEEIVMEGEFSK